MKADVPGVEAKNIHVSLDNNILTIKGERNVEKKEEKEGYTRMERIQGKFHRRFNLPDTADSSRINANTESWK